MRDDAAILRARARELARPLEAPAAGTAVEVLEFNVARERYAIETRCVAEVHALGTLTPVPCTPPFIAGIVNVRGRIVPVLDFRKLFDLPEHGLADSHFAVMLEGNGLAIGLLADTIAGVRLQPLQSLQPSLETLTGIRAEYLRGVTPDRIVVLDGARLLADPKLIVNEEVES